MFIELVFVRVKMAVQLITIHIRTSVFGFAGLATEFNISGRNLSRLL